MFVALAVGAALNVAPPCTIDGDSSYVSNPDEQQSQVRSTPPYDDPVGDAWEMEEVACWTGIWVRRGQSRFFDAYWMHPTGERVRAVLELRRDGRSVTMIRRHEGGKHCRYDGTISPDWWTIEGRYTCTWERTPMRWRAKIVRFEHSLPALLRQP